METPEDDRGNANADAMGDIAAFMPPERPRPPLPAPAAVLPPLPEPPPKPHRRPSGSPPAGTGSGDEVAIPCRGTKEPLPRLAALASAGIPYRLEKTPEGGWEILVPAEFAEQARGELAEYHRVNRGWPPHRQFLPSMPGTYPAGGAAGLVAAAALLAFYAVTGPFDPHVPLQDAGAADALEIMSGDWWRCLTALTLHADLPHVLANSVCLAWFGFFLCRSAGAGLGLLAIVAAGGLGNLVNAWWEKAGHSAVGASTATFAALGILAFFQFRRNWRGVPHLLSFWSRSWLPILAGLGLLGFLGTGPQSDLGGHFFGFLAGLLTGIPLLPAQDRRLPLWVQFPAGLAAAGLLVWAWTLALRATA